MMMELTEERRQFLLGILGSACFAQLEQALQGKIAPELLEEEPGLSGRLFKKGMRAAFKQGERPTNPVAPYIAMLTARELSTKEQAALKTLQESRHPAAPYVSELLGLVAQGGTRS